MDDRAPTLVQPGARAAQETVERALFEIRRVIAGQDQMLERIAERVGDCRNFRVRAGFIIPA